jgi:hypothetical protein
MSSKLYMRSSNKGLTVRINLWALEKFLSGFNPKKARLWISGHMTNAETGEQKMFNDAGELITTLGRWNTAKFKQLRAKAKK